MSKNCEKNSRRVEASHRFRDDVPGPRVLRKRSKDWRLRLTPVGLVLQFLVSVTPLCASGRIHPIRFRDAGAGDLAQGKSRKQRSSSTPSATASNQISRKWYVFKSPDGDFSLEFPAKPRQLINGQGPVTIIQQFDLFLEGGHWFSINFQDLGGDPETPANNEWSEDMERENSAADRAEGRRIVHIHRISRSIIDAEILQTLPNSETNSRYLRRSIIRRARVYSLACGSLVNDQPINNELCQKFFGSLHFMKKPAPRKS